VAVLLTQIPVALSEHRTAFFMDKQAL